VILLFILYYILTDIIIIRLYFLMHTAMPISISIQTFYHMFCFLIIIIVFVQRRFVPTQRISFRNVLYDRSEICISSNLIFRYFFLFILTSYDQLVRTVIGTKLTIDVHRPRGSKYNMIIYYTNHFSYDRTRRFEN